MARSTTEREILSLEKQYWQAIKDNDIETCLSLTDEPCFVAGPHGIGRVDHDQLAKMMESAPYRLKEFTVEDGAQVRFVSDDVAIVAYNVHENRIVDDEERELDAADSSMWVRRDGHWVCALHTESPAEQEATKTS